MATIREITFRIAATSGARFTGPIGTANRALEGMIGRLRGVEQQAARAQRRAGLFGGAFRSALGMAAGYLSIRAVAQGIRSITTEMNGQIRAGQRLDTLMGNVKGTRLVEIKAIKQQASALQNLTTIGDDVTMVGASQLATFQLQAKSIRTLLPSLQNLAVGTYGLNVNQEQAQQSANLLGKVFTGQVGALKRVGISFDKQQEKLLKNGTQAEKVATLVQVIDKNYGGLAKRMRQTPEGAVKSLQNAWGDVQEEIGFRVLPTATRLLNYIGRNIPKAQSTIMRMMDGVSRWVKDNRPLLNRLWETMKKLFEAAKPGLQWLIRDGFPRAIRFTTGLLDISQKTIGWLIDNWDKLKPYIITVGGAILAAKAAWQGYLLVQGIGTMFANLKTLAGLIWGIKLKCDQAAVSGTGMWAAISGPVGWAAAIGTGGYLGMEYAASKGEARRKMRLYYTDAAIDRLAQQAYKKSWAELGLGEMQALAAQHAKAGTTPMGPYEGKSGKTLGPMGGGRGSIGPSRRHAAGGIVTRAHVGMIGEGGPELILPLHRAGEVISINQTINVNGAGNPRETAQAVLTVTKGAVKQALQELLRDERRVAYAG